MTANMQFVATTTSGKAFVGDSSVTSNADISSCGLTVVGTDGGQNLALKGTSVATGFTGEMEGTTYFAAMPLSSTNGGVQFRAYRDAAASAVVWRAGGGDS
jgi:hypothetical protein